MAIEESGLLEERGNERDSDEESNQDKGNKAGIKKVDGDPDDLNMEDFDEFENELNEDLNFDDLENMDMDNLDVEDGANGLKDKEDLGGEKPTASKPKKKKSSKPKSKVPKKEITKAPKGEKHVEANAPKGGLSKMNQDEEEDDWNMDDEDLDMDMDMEMDDFD